MQHKSEGEKQGEWGRSLSPLPLLHFSTDTFSSVHGLDGGGALGDRLALLLVPLRRLGLARLLEPRHRVGVLPAHGGAQLAQADELVAVREPQDLEGVGHDQALDLVVRRRDPFVGLEPVEGRGAALGLVRDHAADGPPDDAGGRAEVDGALLRLRQHALAQEALVLGALADEAAGEHRLLGPDDDDVVADEELLGDDGGEAAEHVPAGVDDDGLGAVACF